MRARPSWIVLSIAFAIGLTVSCNTKNTETKDADTTAILDPIKIDTGCVSGAMMGEVGKEVRIYRGIPYAAPPVGDLRWKPPQPAAAWTGIRESTAFAKSSPQPGLTDIDKKVSENMMAMWTQFARTGNPNVTGLIDWPAYESAKDQYLYIAEPLQVKSGFSKVAQKK
jgi:carboxylesterase type B